ncbi:hypothetical protein CSKR_107687, partial [Clonorchis sinensis]
QLEHEAAWCSTFSCLKTSQTGDSAGFQLPNSDKHTHLQINLAITGDSSSRLVYSVLQLNVLHTGCLIFQLATYSRYRSIFLYSKLLRRDSSNRMCSLLYESC